MKKKELEHLAAEIRSQCPGGIGNVTKEDSLINQRIGWWYAIQAIVKTAEYHNPKFDRKAFYTACGINTAAY